MQKESIWLIFNQGKLLLKNDSGLTLPRGAEPPLHPTGMVFRSGSVLGMPCYTCMTDELPSTGWTPLGLREVFESPGPEVYRPAGRAAQLLYWDANSRFCPVCGIATELAPDVLAKLCPGCGKMIFPKPTAAVLVRVEKEDSILLVRAHNFHSYFHGLVAGYLDAGESLEECARREVLEETGLIIDNLKYFGSESWPFPNNLMVGFTADYVSGEIILQKDELAEAAFYKRGELPKLPRKISLTRRMIDDWVDNID